MQPFMGLVRTDMARLSLFAGVLASAVLCCTVVSAQSGGSAPSFTGQWAGPWDLESQMTIDPDDSQYYEPIVREIAHSIVIPPASPVDAAAPAYGGKVVFMNRRGSLSMPPDDDYPTYLWNPGRPQYVISHLMVPQTVQYDMFCSGHSFLGDGRPFTSGGQNHATQGTVGQSISYILRTDDVASGPPQWMTAATSTASDERWYPTVVTLPDGRMLTTGDTPICNPLPPFDCPPHTGFGDVHHQVYDPANPGWGVLRPNQEKELIPTCPTDPDMQVLHYPRLHVLANGWVMQVDGKASTGAPSHVAWFLRTNDAAPVADCATGAEPYNQWIEGERIPSDTRQASQKGAPSVHMLWPEPGFPLTYHEVVYQFGGHWEPHDDGAGCPVPADGQHYATNRVARITDPDPSKYWMEDVLYMPEGRVNHNAVILLDGSVLLIGGEENTGGGCQYRTAPVVFRPDEFFGGSGGSYYEMADQSDLRRYHSVAGLLPDGRVFSAGGAKEEVPPSSGTYIGAPFSVELFSPSYLFTSPPPVIETTFGDPMPYGQTLDVIVTVPGGGDVDRVALVRVGSSTHAFDASQRYIELLVTNPVSLGNNQWQVTIHTPPDGNVAPPGWYMLTAATQVDGYPFTGSAKYVPSEAKWIKLE